MSGPFAGIDFDAVFTVGDRAKRFPPFSLGQRMQDADGNEYVYVQADGAVTGADYVVVISEAGQAAMATNATALYGDRVGVVKAAFADNDYGWAQVYGAADIRVSASCAANVAIASTVTAGQLDDAAGTNTKTINGMALTAARAASAGSAPGILSYPTVGATN